MQTKTFKIFSGNRERPYSICCFASLAGSEPENICSLITASTCQPTQRRTNSRIMPQKQIKTSSKLKRKKSGLTSRPISPTCFEWRRGHNVMPNEWTVNVLIASYGMKIVDNNLIHSLPSNNMNYYSISIRLQMLYWQQQTVRTTNLLLMTSANHFNVPSEHSLLLSTAVSSNILLPRGARTSESLINVQPCQSSCFMILPFDWSGKKI